MGRAVLSSFVLPLGVLTLLLAWFGPLERLVPGPFSAHMAKHMAVVAVAAPLIALGLAGGRYDPVRRAPALFPPILASLAELLVVWSWHTPLLHRLAQQSPAAFLIEQASFFSSGLWLWLGVLGGDGRGRDRTGAGILALLLTSMHMTLLGALLALPPRALFSHPRHGNAHGDHGAHAAVISPLEDQHLGGAIMLVFGGVVYLVGGLGLAVALLRARQSGATRAIARDVAVPRVEKVH